MVNPISIISLVVEVADLLQQAYNYSKAVQDAQNDMKKLYTELLGLKGALEQLQKLQEPDDLYVPDPHILDLLRSIEFRDMLSSTQLLVGRLIEKLNKKQTSSRHRNAFVWPWVKDDVRADIQNLERVKSWFIVMMMAENSSQMRGLMSDSHEILLVVRESQASQKVQEQDARRQKLKGWIQPFSPVQLQDQAFGKRKGMASTGRWLLEGKFKDWMKGSEGTGRILWLRAGAGKTTLHSAAVEELRSCQKEDPKTGLAFFYCSFDDRESQKPANILGSIAYQLSEQLPQALDGIEGLRKSESTASLSAIRSLILEYTSKFDNFYILVDAINESFNCRDVFSQLLQLVTSRTNVRLLVTAISGSSSLVVDLELQSPPDIMEVDICIEGVERDIDFYIATRMDEARLLRQLNAEAKAAMHEQILRNANKMFRYAQCQLDYLITLRTTRMVNEELDCLPKDIYAIYEKIMSNIPETDGIFARESLFLVAGALRPLTIMEVAEAAILKETDTCLSEEMRLSEPEVLLEICQGLITFDTKTNVVTLAHSSVRSFLTSDRISNSSVSWYSYTLPGIHGNIAGKCLTYLLLDHFRGACSEDGQLEKLCEDYPFLRYASRYWPLHSKLSDSSIGWEQSAIRLFLSHAAPHGSNFSFWVQSLIPDAPMDTIRGAEPLYYAASFGLTDLAKSLLTSKRTNVDGVGGRHRSSALHVACYRGHVDIARDLLECGADVNALDEDGATPLFWAEKIGRREIVDLLKDHKYSHNWSRRGRTVLALSSGPEYGGDYPLWFCCHCDKGPLRGRFATCFFCVHERCNQCIKLANETNSKETPKSQRRWMCCNCESGPSRVETARCSDCEHKKCRHCWDFNISV